MKLEIPLSEVQEFVRRNYHIKVGFANIGGNKVIVNYVVSIALTVKEVQAGGIVFRYESNIFVNLLAKGVHFLLKRKLALTPVKWNSTTRELAVDLNRVKALTELLKLLYISELHFLNGTVVVELKPKPTQQPPKMLPGDLTD
jgi:hypothetical protein